MNDTEVRSPCMRFGVRSRAAMILGRTNDEIEEYLPR